MDSLKYHLKLYRSLIRSNFEKYKKAGIIRNWEKSITRNGTQVLIGANVLATNGVDIHIRAVKNFSEMKIQLMPSDDILKSIKTHEFSIAYVPHLTIGKDVILHSHVYPWFIKWCKSKQLGGNKWVHTYHLPYFKDHSSEVDLLSWQKDFNHSLIHDAREADVRISVAKWQKDYLSETHGISTIYIPNGVNVPLCDAANKENFTRLHGIENFILNVSRHDPVKNPREFVQLAACFPDQMFVIIGADLTEERFMNDYHIMPPNNLTILGGMSQSEVQDAIAACSCLVSTSKREGLPTLVLEGMTQSKAVVVSNEPGSMEAINHGDYGYYYELGNIEDLKNKTLLALKDTSIGVKARQRILEEYDWRVVIKQIDRLYME